MHLIIWKIDGIYFKTFPIPKFIEQHENILIYQVSFTNCCEMWGAPKFG